jgi:hypothetical protein
VYFSFLPCALTILTHSLLPVLSLLIYALHTPLSFVLLPGFPYFSRALSTPPVNSQHLLYNLYSSRTLATPPLHSLLFPCTFYSSCTINTAPVPDLFLLCTPCALLSPLLPCPPYSSRAVPTPPVYSLSSSCAISTPPGLSLLYPYTP